MSKKKKIIISVTAAVLVLAMVLTCVAVVIGNKKDREREREEYEQVQNATNNHENSDPSETTPDSDIPPVIVPEDTEDETVQGDIILDVTDEDRDPNPGIVDATIEYDTKEGADDAE